MSPFSRRSKSCCKVWPKSWRRGCKRLARCRRRSKQSLRTFTALMNTTVGHSCRYKVHPSSLLFDERLFSFIRKLLQAEGAHREYGDHLALPLRSYVADLGSSLHGALYTHATGAVRGCCELPLHIFWTYGVLTGPLDAHNSSRRRPLPHSWRHVLISSRLSRYMPLRLLQDACICVVLAS